MDQLQFSELRTIRSPWPVDEFLCFIFTCFFNIFIAEYCGQQLLSWITNGAASKKVVPASGKHSIFSNFPKDR